MTTAAQEVLDKALRLPLKQRARLIAELLASMDGKTDPGAEQAWGREIALRARRALAGESAGSKWSTVRERIRKTRAGR